jgi:serine/threonine protein kinase
LKEERSVIAKIIDLGLAKTVDDSASETAISIPGSFAGTPEFASPEQSACLGGRYPFGPVLAWRDALGHANRPGAIPRFFR